jgi:hypothetical protein
MIWIVVAVLESSDPVDLTFLVGNVMAAVAGSPLALRFRFAMLCRVSISVIDVGPGNFDAGNFFLQHSLA